MTHPTNIVDLDSLILAEIVELRAKFETGDTPDFFPEYEQAIINDALVKSIELMLENANIKGTSRIWDIVHDAAFNYKDIFQSQTARRCVIRLAFGQIKEIISELAQKNNGMKSVDDLVEEMRTQMANNPKGYGYPPITMVS